jgi:hypothetical protein
MQGQSATPFALLGALLCIAVCGCASRNEPPPISAAAAAKESAGGYPISGQYRGEGVALNDPGGFCSSRMQVTNWIVTGNQVSFGSFNGTIQRDGALVMQVGPSYLQGRFTGSHFVGRFSAPQPSCAYQITVDPVG